jgi:hypothetical protein
MPVFVQLRTLSLSGGSIVQRRRGAAGVSILKLSVISRFFDLR